MSLTEDTSQLNDSLHALHLSLNDNVEVLLLDIREGQEVDGTGVARLRVLRDEFPQALVEVLGQEGRV